MSTSRMLRPCLTACPPFSAALAQATLKSCQPGPPALTLAGWPACRPRPIPPHHRDRRSPTSAACSSGGASPPRRRLGQNFLIDLNLHDVIVNAAEIEPTDVILEVGPGAGALTSRMAPLASAVVAVEFDPEMAFLTSAAVASFPNVRILNMDALAGKNRMNPLVLDNVRSGLAIGPDRQFKLVANLPYNIATPLVTNLLVQPDPALVPVRMVVTIQLELAQKMTAEPATSHYSGLSVLMQALADVEIVRTLAPTVFWPRPRSIRQLSTSAPMPRNEPRWATSPGSTRWSAAFSCTAAKTCEACCTPSGKTSGATRPRSTRSSTELGLAEFGHIRAEAMDTDEFLALSEVLRQRLGPASSQAHDQ